MNPLRRTEVAVGIVLKGDQLLIARRPPGVPLAGLWEFPGGKLEPGETPESAVERELMEELAIGVQAERRLTVLEHDYPYARVILMPILCRHTTGHPTAIHCSEWRWISLSDLPAYAFPPANAPLLQELAALGLQRPRSAVNFDNP